MAFSSFSRIINAKYCIKIPYIARVIAISIYFFSGFISLFFILHIVEGDNFDTTAAFCLTLIPSIIMGTGGAFGEASILGYLRIYPKNYVAAWSSGTGFAGVGGALITLVFKLKNIKTKNLYLYMSPVCALYFITFFVIDRIYQNTKNERNKERASNTDLGLEKGKVLPIRLNESDHSLQGTLISEDENTDVTLNKEMSFLNFKTGFSIGKRYILNLAIVYYLEYNILAGFADRVCLRKYIKDEPFYSHDIVYETLSLCYQIGVTLSRSSLVLVKRIPCVEVFTICQGINFVIWIVEVYTNFIYYGYILFFHMIIVGLMGGAAYVGCFYFILENNDIPSTLKELCVNIGTIFNDIGILTASATVLLLDNTIMK